MVPSRKYCENPVSAQSAEETQGDQWWFVYTKRMLPAVNLCPPRRDCTSMVHFLIKTVDNNKINTKLENNGACKTQSLQDITGRPTNKDFLHYVENNMLKNCPVLKKDILRAKDMIGLSLVSLKVIITRKIPPRIVLNSCKDLLECLLEWYRDVTLTQSILIIMTTTSRAIHFGMAEMIENEKA